MALCFSGMRLSIAVMALGLLAPVRSDAGDERLAQDAHPNVLCAAAVHAAEFHYRLPSGLLFAISQVESGRPDPTMHRLEPWPWTVQAEGRSLYFEDKAGAVRWVKEAHTRGVMSIDTGCLQVNLFYHPDAFQAPEEAFDPQRNADYAARFLLQLYTSTGDWQKATGFYHSQTLTLANLYRERIDRALKGDALSWPAPIKPPTVVDRLADAWRATLGTTDQSSTTHDWSILLHKPQQQPPKPAPRLRRYADQSFLPSNTGRSQ
jgi:hypothetical protein